MKSIIETENLSLDYDLKRSERDLGEYMLQIYDIHGNYIKHMYLTPRQMKDLADGLQNVSIDYKEFL